MTTLWFLPVMVYNIYQIKEADLMASNTSNNELFRRLTENVEEASAEESTEIIHLIESMSEDDLTTVSTNRKEIRP